MSHPEQAMTSNEQEFDAGGRQREMAQMLEAAADRIASPQKSSEHFIARRIGEEGRARAAAELRQKAIDVQQPPPELSWAERFKAS